jgi:hypothetical protein
MPSPETLTCPSCGNPRADADAGPLLQSIGCDCNRTLGERVGDAERHVWRMIGIARSAFAALERAATDLETSRQRLHELEAALGAEEADQAEEAS